jgi:hypothetical protein
MSAPGSRWSEMLNAARRRILVEALATYHGNITHAAVSLGIKRITVYKLCRRLDIDAAYYRVRKADEPPGGRGGDPLQRDPHPSPSPGGANARAGGATDQPALPSRPGR